MRQRQNIFAKSAKKCNLSALLNFVSLHIICSYPPEIRIVNFHGQGRVKKKWCFYCPPHWKKQKMIFEKCFFFLSVLWHIFWEATSFLSIFQRRQGVGKLRKYYKTLQIEKRNSKGRSGFTFWQISQKYFTASNFEEINRWLKHQLKSLILYFDIENQSISFFFWKFCGNRQSEFHPLKFNVCKHTLNLNKWNSLCLFSTKFSTNDID